MNLDSASQVDMSEILDIRRGLKKRIREEGSIPDFVLRQDMFPSHSLPELLNNDGNEMRQGSAVELRLHCEVHDWIPIEGQTPMSEGTPRQTETSSTGQPLHFHRQKCSPTQNCDHIHGEMKSPAILQIQHQIQFLKSLTFTGSFEISTFYTKSPSVSSDLLDTSDHMAWEWEDASTQFYMGLHRTIDIECSGIVIE